MYPDGRGLGDTEHIAGCDWLLNLLYKISPYGLFYLFFSEVKTYFGSADSTLPSVPKKRKLEEEEIEQKSKKIKKEVEDDTSFGRYIIHVLLHKV